MKIQPPGGAPPGPPPLEEVKPGLKAQEAPGVGFSEKLEKLQGAEKTAASEAAGAAGPQAAQGTMAAHLEAVSREMEAGRIQTREQAVERLVDRLVDSKFGGKLPPESLAQLKTAVAAEVAADPSLSERIERLLARAQGAQK
jgi:hypothetical protein